MKEATVERTGTVDCDNCGIRVPATEALLGTTRLSDGTEELVAALCSECAGPGPEDDHYPSQDEIDAYYEELQAEHAEAMRELQREHREYLRGGR